MGCWFSGPVGVGGSVVIVPSSEALCRWPILRIDAPEALAPVCPDLGQPVFLGSRAISSVG